MGELFEGVDGVLYFGNDCAGANRTSSHHIAKLLAERERLVYVDCPGLRAPSGTATDLKKIARKLRAYASGPAPRAGLPVETILQLPLHGLGAVRMANQLLLRAAARRIMQRHGMRRPIAWFTVPHLAPLAKRLGEALSVYYCVDDYAEMPGVDRLSVQRMDEHLTRNADVVFVASETLLERKRRLNPHTFASPHGVDVRHFRRAQDPELRIPEELEAIRGTVVGYFGLIDGRTDLDLIAYLADRRPGWTFFMVGQLAVKPHEVPRRPNIVYAGARPYEDLPAYGKRFDAVIMPYRVTATTMHANPIKLREYLAMGKPVVTVALPQTQRFADVVALASTPDDFLSRLDEAVREQGDTARVQRRIERVAAMSWESRVREIARVVAASLAVRARPSNRNGWAATAASALVRGATPSVAR